MMLSFLLLCFVCAYCGAFFFQPKLKQHSLFKIATKVTSDEHYLQYVERAKQYATKDAVTLLALDMKSTDFRHLTHCKRLSAFYQSKLSSILQRRVLEWFFLDIADTLKNDAFLREIFERNSKRKKIALQRILKGNKFFMTSMDSMLRAKNIKDAVWEVFGIASTVPYPLMPNSELLYGSFFAKVHGPGNVVYISSGATEGYKLFMKAISTKYALKLVTFNEADALLYSGESLELCE